MEVVAHGAGNMIELSFASNESRRCVLNRLKWTKMGFVVVIVSRVSCLKVLAKAEAVEFLRRSVRRMKDRAQLIVDDIEMNKLEMINKLGGAGLTCEEAQLALSMIQSSDVDFLCADDKHCPSHLVARIMDCVLLMFQRPLNAVDVDVERNCIKPSWNQLVKVRNSSMSNFQLLIFSFLMQYAIYLSDS